MFGAAGIPGCQCIANADAFAMHGPGARPGLNGGGQPWVLSWASASVPTGRSHPGHLSGYAVHTRPSEGACPAMADPLRRGSSRRVWADTPDQEPGRPNGRCGRPSGLHSLLMPTWRIQAMRTLTPGALGCQARKPLHSRWRCTACVRSDNGAVSRAISAIQSRISPQNRPHTEDARSVSTEGA